MTLFLEPSDVSVRPAVPGDEDELARVQLAAWRGSHATLLGEEVLAALEPAALASRWRAAIETPPGPRYRVLVALAGPEVVGLASVAPIAGDEPAGGEILALEVLPAARRAGHGSRLLAAAVDLLREDGATWVRTWVLGADTAREAFLASAGLGPDGVQRVLAQGVGTARDDVVERAWSALL